MLAMYVAERPSLPVGFKADGLPPVQRSLYSDGAFEVYLLEGTTQSDLLLIRDRVSGGLDMSGLDLLPPELIERLPRDLNLPGTFALRVSGSWLPDHGLRLSNWDAFLLESLKQLRSAFEHGLRFNLHPALMWVSRRPPVLLPLFAKREQSSEQEIVREFAALIMSASTGIDAASIATLTQDRLQSWNRDIPPEAFSLLVACLATRNKSHISSFQGLEDRLAGRSESQQQASNRKPESDSHSGLNNIAGMNQLKEWLRKEILGPLKDPELYRKYRIEIPNGILFYGPPGCGKTYVARRLAEELGYFFKEAKPSDVASPFIHSTVLRIRELFDQAIEKAPSVLFIDEFDAFAPSRSGLGGHQQYKSEEVNEFLANLEGAARQNVLVIAATNTPDKIDPAIRRTGRFDKLVYIPPPDQEARTAMLAYHLTGRPVDEIMDLPSVALVLNGYSASDLKMLVDEAARQAFERKASISTDLVLSAIQRVPPSITAREQERYLAFGTRGF